MPYFAVLACLSVLLLSACGGDAASSGPDPASLVPPTAAMYVEGVIKPDGGVRADAEAALAKILDTDDPGGRLAELLEQASDEPRGAWDTDIEPWIGARVGVALKGFDQEEPGATLVVAAEDPEAGVEMLLDEDENEGAAKRSTEGHDYYSRPGAAFGAVDDFVVYAESDADFKAAAVAADGDSLAEREIFTDAVERLPDERLGFIYFDQRRIFEEALGSAGGEEAQIFGSLFEVEKLQPMAVALLADEERVAIETTGTTEGSPLGGFGAFTGEGVELLGELPADAWGAFGVADVGETARTLLRTFAGALGGAALEGEFRRQTGLDLQRDVLGWIGDVAVFVTGAGADGLRGAVVIEVTDGDRAATAFGKLTGLLQVGASVDMGPVEVDGAESAFEVRDPELPDTVVLARSAERVVAAFGRDAAAAALAGDDELSDSELFAAAEDALGEAVEPAFVLDMEQVLANVEAFGAGEDPDFRQARSYLDAFHVITAGGKGDGDEQRSIFAAGLK